MNTRKLVKKHASRDKRQWSQHTSSDAQAAVDTKMDFKGKKKKMLKTLQIEKCLKKVFCSAFWAGPD